MKFIVLLLFSGIIESPSAQIYNIDFQARQSYLEKNIRWITVDDISGLCQLKMMDKVNKKNLACSEYNDQTCTIFTGRNTNMAILGHEIRHCFEGQWHP